MYENDFLSSMHGRKKFGIVLVIFNSTLSWRNLPILQAAIIGPVYLSVPLNANIGRNV